MARVPSRQGVLSALGETHHWKKFEICPVLKTSLNCSFEEDASHLPRFRGLCKVSVNADLVGLFELSKLICKSRLDKRGNRSNNSWTVHIVSSLAADKANRVRHFIQVEGSGVSNQLFESVCRNIQDCYLKVAFIPSQLVRI